MSKETILEALLHDCWQFTHDLRNPQPLRERIDAFLASQQAEQHPEQAEAAQGERIVQTAPERIYLIVGEECPRDIDFSDLPEVTWCEDDAAAGIEYVRADKARAALAQPSPCIHEKMRVARKVAIEGLRSLSHEELLERAEKNAQPSPKCATCHDSEMIFTDELDHNGNHIEVDCPDCAQPSPANSVAPTYQFQSREIGESDWAACDYSWYLYCSKSPEMDTRIVEVAARPSPAPELERLRYKAELYDEVWELVTAKGYMNVTTAISKLEAERDAAVSRLAEMEGQEPVATVGKVPGEDWNSLDFHCDLQSMKQGTKLYARPVAQAGQVPEEWRAVLQRLEDACDKRSALFSAESYRIAIQTPGFGDAMSDLDDAREAARDLLDAAPQPKKGE